MEITPLGHASFRIRGKQATIVTDPFDPEAVGMKFPQTIADIITISHGHRDHSYARGVSENPIVLDGVGEYEIKGVRITSIATFHDNEKGAKRGKNVLFHFIIDGVGVAHSGDLGHKLTEEQVNDIPGVDILMIPVGGHYTLDVKEATAVVTQLEPKIVIPMHYRHERLDPTAFGDLLTVEAFLKEIGKSGIVPQPKLTISKDKLPAELQVVVLE